ncbi:MAG: HD domain-containing protein [Nitrospiraceae bacterium]|nr:MAG: HD domain-containing protein [Nitrospiraceae bacterium]
MNENAGLSEATMYFIDECTKPYLKEIKSLNVEDVIKELIELLERNKDCPSVVFDRLDGEHRDYKPVVRTLADVSLQAHSYNVARYLIEEVKTYFSDYANFIPWALIAGLGHDIGKTPELRILHPHTVDDHQITSVRKLFELMSGKAEILSKRVIVAVEHHHTFSVDDPFTNMLKKADHRARNQELVRLRKGFQEGRFIDWFESYHFFNSIEPEINHVNEKGKWKAFTFRGVLYCTPDFLFETVRKQCIEKQVADMAFIKHSEQASALKIIVNYLQEHNMIYHHLKPGQYFRVYEIAFYAGRKIRIPHIPLKPYIFFDLREIESRKIGILQIIKSVTAV